MAKSTPAAVDALVDEYRPMAQRLARRYSNGPSLDPDLRQVAELGLFLAASRYDSDAGPFRPYAMATIMGELKKHLRSNGWTVKVPRSLQEDSITAASAAQHLEQELQRSPTPGEVATFTGLSVERVLAALQIRNARFASEQPMTEPAAADEYSVVDEEVDLHEAASTLSSADQHLLHSRFHRELSQREIAAELGISQTQVNRRLAAVLEKLRHEFATADQEVE